MPEDATTLFKWRNFPEIINLGSSRRKVSREEHIQWFSQIIKDANSRLYIIVINEMPVGQLRLVAGIGNDAEISVFLIPGHTGVGHGVTAIVQGCEQFFDEFPIRAIVAFVRETNHRSLSAFEKAGFVHDLDGEQRADHHRLELRRA